MRQNSKDTSLARNAVNLVAVVVIFLLVTACFCRSERAEESPLKKPVADEPAAAPEKADKKTSQNKTADKKADEGDFIVEHLGVQNPRYAGIDKQIKDNKTLEKAANDLNQSLVLPFDIFLRTKDCGGDVNAFYDPNDHSVTVCYELMEQFYRNFRKAGSSEQEAYNKMFDAVRFAFLHEIGHALIDAYKLPITGNEEDAADRASTYINLEELGESGVRAVLAAADSFAMDSKNRTPNDRSMADEHLLQEQRFYNSLCLIYGSNTSKYDYIVTEGYLPKERAVRCPGEYERTVQSWSELLKPWRKE